MVCRRWHLSVSGTLFTHCFSLATRGAESVCIEGQSRQNSLPVGDDPGHIRDQSHGQASSDETGRTHRYADRRSVLGFVPVVTMHATRLDGSTTSAINELSEIQYEKKNGYFVPVAIDIRGNGNLKIKATCRWQSVNGDIDPKVFTVEGFEPKKGTAIFELKGPQPVFLGFTGKAAQDGRGPQRPRCR